MRRNDIITGLAIIALLFLTAFMAGCTGSPVKALEEFSIVGLKEASAHQKNDERIKRGSMKLWDAILPHTSMTKKEQAKKRAEALKLLNRNVEQAKESVEMWTELKEFLDTLDPRKMLKFMKKKLEKIKKRTESAKKNKEKEKESVHARRNINTTDKRNNKRTYSGVIGG